MDNLVGDTILESFEFFKVVRLTLVFAKQLFIHFFNPPFRNPYSNVS